MGEASNQSGKVKAAVRASKGKGEKWNGSETQKADRCLRERDQANTGSMNMPKWIDYVCWEKNRQLQALSPDRSIDAGLGSCRRCGHAIISRTIAGEIDRQMTQTERCVNGHEVTGDIRCPIDCRERVACKAARAS